MKSILTLFLQFILVSFLTGQELNQQLISTSGNTYINQSYQLDWSLGEIMIESYSKNNNLHLQGFHQIEFQEITISMPISNYSSIEVFPNPVVDFIHFEIDETNLENWQFKITDSNGVCLFSDKISGPRQTLNFSDYPAGTYFLTFLHNLQTIRTFILIKN